MCFVRPAKNRYTAHTIRIIHFIISACKKIIQIVPKSNKSECEQVHLVTKRKVAKDNPRRAFSGLRRDGISIVTVAQVLLLCVYPHIGHFCIQLLFHFAEQLFESLLIVFDCFLLLCYNSFLFLLLFYFQADVCVLFPIIRT